MAKKYLPDIETLRQLLRYDPETGFLYWLPRTPNMFVKGAWTKERICKNWNSRYANKKAFNINCLNGYKKGTFNKHTFLAHRIAYAIYYERWPICEIDHINGNRKDNRIINLREVNKYEQSINQKLSYNNKSGCKGVYKLPNGKWRSRIQAYGKDISLGYFYSFDEAVFARKSAEKKYHGEYARSS